MNITASKGILDFFEAVILKSILVFSVSDSLLSVRYFSREIPAIKNIIPRMVKAQGLRIKATLPNIPRTPITKAMAPPTVIINPKTLIISIKFIYEIKLIKVLEGKLVLTFFLKSKAGFFMFKKISDFTPNLS